ncbi:hypothetical protein [Chitinophaga sp. YIM B06452]|uniref:hypothetical protein n=1 Tax=Chitinophaga sp. YIM B06452 TaxID=3082158 RepID=UPI0031FE8230
MALRIYLRHFQIYDVNNAPIFYDGPGPLQLKTYPGTVSQTTWKDFTANSDLDKIRLSWVENNTDDGGTNVQAGISSQIPFYGAAADFIKEWLNDHVAAPLNAVEAILEDHGCGKFSSFLIKNDGLRYCEDGHCEVEVTLKQADSPYTCIQKTLITDNWQGWFPAGENPLNAGKKHPRFAYCDEFRPAFFLGLLFSCISMIALPMYILSVTLVPVVLAIITIVSVVVRKLKKLRDQLKDMTGWGPVTEAIRKMYLNASGCGREMPAPLIRDYIANVCDRCKIQYSKETVPIFFDPASPYYNLTWYQAELEKGFRKDNADQYWIPSNDPLLTLDLFLNQLRPVFNAKWEIKGQTLIFKRKDQFDQSVVFDFTGPDRHKLVAPICYEWNGEKKPAYARAGYSPDATDTVGNDAMARFNTFVEFNNPLNPILEGEMSKIINFAPARFRFDGVASDYIEDAAKSMIDLTGNLLELITHNFRDTFRELKNGVLLVKDDKVMMPKLLLWNGESYRDARVVGPYGWPNNFPQTNRIYNLENKSYPQEHPDAIGRSDTCDPVCFKEYSTLWNWPLVFDEMFLGNLWDQFHQIDDPRVNPPMNKTFTVQMELCCSDIEKLSLLNDSSQVRIGSRVKLLDKGWYPYGTIKSIELNYDPTVREGRYIQIKGIQ